MLEKRHLTNFCLEPKECSPLDYTQQREKGPRSNDSWVQGTVSLPVNTQLYTGGCSLAALTVLESALRVSGDIRTWPAPLCEGALFLEELRTQAYVQLAHLVVGIALGEVLHVGQLQVHLCEPHQNALPGPLKFLPLIGEMLQKGRGITFVLMGG